MRVCLTLLVFFLSSSLPTYGQDFSKHLWQNRLLVMVADNPSFFEEQLSELSGCQNEFSDRKVLIYQVLPDSFRIITSDNPKWNRTTINHPLDNAQGEPYTILIGLDGGVKLKKTHPVSCTEITHLIDQMPMRRAELEKD